MFPKDNEKWLRGSVYMRNLKPQALSGTVNFLAKNCLNLDIGIESITEESGKYVSLIKVTFFKSLSLGQYVTQTFSLNIGYFGVISISPTPDGSGGLAHPVNIRMNIKVNSTKLLTLYILLHSLG
jgi:hypothetical protein